MTEHPSAAPAPEPAAAPPTPPPGPVESGKGRGLAFKIIGPIIGIVVIAGGGFLIRNVISGDQDVPEVGECMNNAANPNDMEVVDCGAAEATWRVVHNDGTMSEQEFDSITDNGDICQDVPNWAGDAMWLGEETSDGTGEGELLCLAPVDAAAE